MKPKAKGRELTHGAAVLIFTAIIVKLIGALFKIPLASKQVLGDVGFGHFSLAYDLFTPFYSLAMAGLPVAVAKTVAENIALGDKLKANSVLKISRKVYGLIGFIALLLFAVFLYPYSYLNNISSSGVISLVAVLPAVFFCSYMSSYRGYYEGMNNMYPTAVSELIEALCKLILGLGFGFAAIKLTADPALSAAASILGISLGTASATLYLEIYHKIKLKGNDKCALVVDADISNEKCMSKALLVLAVPIALSSLAANVSLIGDALTLKTLLNSLVENSGDFLSKNFPLLNGEGFEMATVLYGVKGRAYTLFNLVLALTSVIAVSAVPVIAGFKAQKDDNSVKQNIFSVIRLTAFITMPVGVGFIFIGDRIMALLYDSVVSVEVGGNLLRLFGIAVLFAGFTVPLTGVLQALGKQKRALYNIFIGVLVKIILNVVLIPISLVNINGVALSTIGCYAVITMLDITLISKEIDEFKNLTKIFIKPTVAAVLCGVVALVSLFLKSGELNTILAIFLAGFVYILALLLLKFFKIDDFEYFIKNKKILEFCQKYKILS